VVFLPGGRSPRGLEAHADFLAAVGLAARGLVREGVPVRVGVVFLGGDVLEPEFSPEEGNLQALAERLRQAARALVEADVRGRWPGRDVPVCTGLACGYVGHCHPGVQARSISMTDRGEAC